MLTEILSGVVGATTAGLVTHFISRPARRATGELLEGRALIDTADYPVRVGSDGLLTIDAELFQRSCQSLIDAWNPRAAIDLLYLAEHNRDLVNCSEQSVLMLHRLRSRYRRWLRELVEPRVLADQREHVLNQFRRITEGLGDTFQGVPIEFVLHDTRDPRHSVCVIKNSITGRKAGDQVTACGEDVVRVYTQARWAGTQHSYRLRHLRTGQEFKATTIPLEDKTLGLIAFLCINIDISRLAPSSPELPELVARLVDTPHGWGAQVVDVVDSPTANRTTPRP